MQNRYNNRNNNRNNRKSNRRRNGRVAKAPMELAAMQARLTNGPWEPPQTALSIKTTYRHFFEVVVTSANAYGTVTSGIICASLGGGGATAWSSFRLLKIVAFSTATADGSYIAVKMPGDTSFLNSNDAPFIDYGVAGASPPHLAVTPSFIQRARWYQYDPTGTVPVFSVAAATATAPVQLYLTLELESYTQAPTLKREQFRLDCEQTS